MKNYIFIVCFFIFCSSKAQERAVDFIKIEAVVEPQPVAKKIKGVATYTFFLNQRIDSVFIDAKNINVTQLKLNGRRMTILNDGKKIGFKAPRKLGKHDIVLSYVAQPKKALYFIGFDDDLKGNEQIWTQGQGKFTSNWLPSFDDMTEKVEFDLILRIDEGLTAIANGKLLKVKSLKGKQEWSFNMKKPMSSYLVAFAIGTYNKQVLTSKSGVSIENYYYPKDGLRVEPTYRYTKEIFDFLEAEIGVPYPWQNYKQVPVHDFLYGGMENTSATLFSDAYMIDKKSFVDKNYVNVNAHELAHQWFGDLVTEESGNHHWLQEGFATYYAYLAEKEVFGDDHFYWKLYQTALNLKERSDKGDGYSLLNPKADSITFYEKGAWALILLREELGDDVFKTGMINYLNTYSFKNVTITNFLTEMEKVSGKRLSEFKWCWLEEKSFPFDQVLSYLRRYSSSIAQYETVKNDVKTSKSYYKDSIMTSLWGGSTSVALKKQFFLDFNNTISDSLLLHVLDKQEVVARQVLSEVRDPIFRTLKPLFESMLEDESYVTVENALYKLWVEFPDDRIKYLDKTKDIIGLPNKNVHMLWLTLAMVTPTYNLVKKSNYLKELMGYTSKTYNPEIRQVAFLYLKDLDMLEDEALINLIKATNHHSWQFKIFARRLLDTQLQDEEQLKKIDFISKDMDENDLQYLRQKLE